MLYPIIEVTEGFQFWNDFILSQHITYKQRQVQENFKSENNLKNVIGLYIRRRNNF